MTGMVFVTDRNVTIVSTACLDITTVYVYSFRPSDAYMRQ